MKELAFPKKEAIKNAITKYKLHLKINGIVFPLKQSACFSVLCNHSIKTKKSIMLINLIGKIEG